MKVTITFLKTSCACLILVAICYAAFSDFFLAQPSSSSFLLLPFLGWLTIFLVVTSTELFTFILLPVEDNALATNSSFVSGALLIIALQLKILGLLAPFVVLYANSPKSEEEMALKLVVALYSSGIVVSLLVLLVASCQFCQTDVLEDAQ